MNREGKRELYLHQKSFGYYRSISLNSASSGRWSEEFFSLGRPLTVQRSFSVRRASLPRSFRPPQKESSAPVRKNKPKGNVHQCRLNITHSYKCRRRKTVWQQESKVVTVPCKITHKTVQKFRVEFHQ